MSLGLDEHPSKSLGELYDGPRWTRFISLFSFISFASYHGPEWSSNIHAAVGDR